MSNKTIIKVSFTNAGKKGVSLGYKNYRGSTFIGTTDKNYKDLPTEDFTNALQRLKWHLLFLTEFFKAEDYGKVPAADLAIAESYRVCGLTVTGSDEKEGIMITGYKTLSNGKGFSFNSPNLKWSEDYVHIEDLKTAWAEVKKEAGEYLGGKHASVQVEMDLEPAEMEEPSGSN